MWKSKLHEKRGGYLGRSLQWCDRRGVEQHPIHLLDSAQPISGDEELERPLPAEIKWRRAITVTVWKKQ